MRPPPSARYYHPRYQTVAHRILEIEREHKTAEHHVDDTRLLDLLIEDARARIVSLELDGPDPEERGLTVLRTLGELLEGCGITYSRQATLGQALRLGGANCDSASSLYLAFGEVLDLPIAMVRAPGHTFVRWQLDDDRYINWETTVAEQRSDEHYITKHQIPRVALGKSALRSLDPRRDASRILANAYVNSGVTWLGKGDPLLAIERFLEAARRDPHYVTPYYNLGLTYYNEGDPAAAVVWCGYAVRLNPNHVKSHAILAAAHELLGDHAAAARHRQEVERVDAGYYSRRS
jgi:tetratricopeptide (TPR) repeat protein